LEGEIVNPDREETSIELDVPAFIPEIYISDELLKLQMYKKIAAIRDVEDETEVLDELIDRFGEPPVEVSNLVKVSHIRALAEKAGIVRIYEEQKKIAFEFHERNQLTPERIAGLSEKFGLGILIHAGVKPFIKINSTGKNKLHQVIIFLNHFVVY
jgi:transcription-repair coupling factor (superfamily II helicase)